MAEKDSKTEKPTQWRLRKAAEKGDVPRSRDLVQSTSLLLTVLFFALYTPGMARSLLQLMRGSLATAAERTVSDAALTLAWRDGFAFWLQMLGPLFALLVAAAVLMNIVQGGFHLVPENLRFKASSFHLLKGLKRIFATPEALMELLKSLVKVALIGLVATLTIRDRVPGLLPLVHTSLAEVLEAMGSLFFTLALRVTLLLLALSVLDVLWTRWRHTQKLKMSKQEVRDEYKMVEGDPKIKSRQRSLQYQKAIQRMMAEVPKADVVITNPTHYAVALVYEYRRMASPKVVAKGKDLMAERIKKVARESGVPLVENAAVARGLYAAVEIGQFVPAEFFRPVAEILAYIYRLKNRRFA